MTYAESLASIGAAADAEVASLLLSLNAAQSDLADALDANVAQDAAHAAEVAALEARIADLEAQVAALTPTDPVDPDPVTPAPTGALRYRPPVLVNPTTITLTNASRKATMDPTKDYIVRLGEVIDTPSGIELNGGRNVVLIGGTIRFSRDYSGGVVTELGKKNRAVFIKGLSTQTAPRTVHIEGLHIAGDFTWEGINVDSQSEPNLTVTLQNIRVDRINVYLPGTTGSHEGGDVFQCWNGPTELRIDRLTGADCRYQGLFIQSNAFGTGVERPYTISRVNLSGRQPSSAYLLWHASPSSIPLNVSDVWVDSTDAWPDGCIWPKDGNATWKAQRGTPPGGDFVPAGVAGVGYVSPGYL